MQNTKKAVNQSPVERLRHHVTGAIERGEKQAIVEQTDSRTVASVKWDKVPSVTSGGKPYFYNTVTSDYAARRTIVWDRFCKIWVIKGPQTLEHPYGKPYMTCDSVREAMQYVESGKAI